MPCRLAVRMERCKPHSISCVSAGREDRHWRFARQVKNLERGVCADLGKILGPPKSAEHRAGINQGWLLRWGKHIQGPELRKGREPQPDGGGDGEGSVISNGSGCYVDGWPPLHRMTKDLRYRVWGAGDFRIRILLIWSPRAAIKN